MAEVIPASERTYRAWSLPKQQPPTGCAPYENSCSSQTGNHLSFEPLHFPKGDPPAPEPFHPDFQSTTHIALQTRDVLPDPNKGPVLVSIIDGSKGKRLCKKVDRSETVATMKQKFLQEMPELQWLSLVCNGKPLQECQVLRDLQLGEKVTFVTFQRCHGG